MKGHFFVSILFVYMNIFIYSIEILGQPPSIKLHKYNIKIIIRNDTYKNMLKYISRRVRKKYSMVFIYSGLDKPDHYKC